MTDMTIDPKRLDDLLDLFGADFDRWPDRTAAQQARLAALQDPDFRHRFEAAKRLDSAFRSLSTEIESRVPETRLAALEETILRQVEPQAERRRLLSVPVLRRLAASALVACALGAGLGEWAPLLPEAAAEAYDELLLGTADAASDIGIAADG